MRITPAPAHRDWMSGTNQQFAKRCLPLLMANQAGWHLLNDQELTAEWDGGPNLASLDVRYGGTPPERPFASSHFGYGILTWSVPYLFRTPAGFNLQVRGPANHPKDGIQALEGLVETDWALATFTVNWKLTRPGLPVTFAANEPIALLLPQRRGELAGFVPEIRDLATQPEAADGYRNWDRSRRAYVGAQHAGLTSQTEWQKHYFRGTAPGGEQAPEHEVRLRLRPFDSAT